MPSDNEESRQPALTDSGGEQSAWEATDNHSARPPPTPIVARRDTDDSFNTSNISRRNLFGPDGDQQAYMEGTYDQGVSRTGSIASIASVSSSVKDLNDHLGQWRKDPDVKRKGWEPKTGLQRRRTGLSTVSVPERSDEEGDEDDDQDANSTDGEQPRSQAEPLAEQSDSGADQTAASSSKPLGLA